MINNINLKNITVDSLRNYLKNDGWKLDESFPNKKVFLYKKKLDDDTFSITVPASSNFKDYSIRVNDIIELLSELYGKSSNIITERILNNSGDLYVIDNKEIEEIKNDKDIMSFRIMSKECENGSIPLEYGANIVEGLKKLILSAIFSEENPRPYFFRPSRDTHIELSRYKLAQTEVGSYIFNIEIENDYANQIEFDNTGIIQDISHQRKVIKRIQNGIQKVIQVRDNGNTEELFKTGYKSGLNANMCDALLSLKNEDNDLSIESTVKWSNKLPQPYGIVDKVVLKNDDFYIIKNISEKYKENKPMNTEVKGKITRLSNNKNSQGISIERNIVIKGKVDGKDRRIKVDLNDYDYMDACEAHKKDLEISVKGELTKNGKNWLIDNYKEFKVFDK
ncbi:hypothetical protein IO99_00525 [Clostridium sulfidigenes]|uniref:Uncharacterized protein n=1 Tax=Clostridium sulfidigenes TaxID=318464 RepID=A0A084JIB5_9CLOT|nr:hypothetical protein [Clostridium sulfidigenes]KEZ88699.1 hypothetical protein IO99_00525 [Clostridium sulfidigenes]